MPSHGRKGFALLDAKQNYTISFILSRKYKIYVDGMKIKVKFIVEN